MSLDQKRLSSVRQTLRSGLRSYRTAAQLGGARNDPAYPLRALK